MVAHTPIGDNALGAGLLAFLVLVVASLVWGVRDRRAIGFGSAAALWAAVSVLFALGWLAFDAFNGGVDPGFVPFVLLLLYVPAALGTGFGQLIRRKVAWARSGVEQGHSHAWRRVAVLGGGP